METNKKKLGVFATLGLGYGIFVAIIVVLIIFAITRVNFIDSRLEQVNNVNSVKQRVAIDFRGSVHDRSIGIRDVVIDDGKGELKNVISLIRKLESNYAQARERMKQNFESVGKLDSQESEILSRIDSINNQTLPLIDKIIAHKQNGDDASAMKDLEKVRGLFVSWLATINEFIDLEESKNQSITPVVQSSVSAFKMILMISGIISLILGVVIAYSIISYLSKILGGEPNIASKALKAIASGDLAQHISYKNPQSMLGDINAMQERLKSIVGGILESANGIFKNTQLVAQSSSNSQKASVAQSEAAQESAIKIKEVHQGIFEISTIAKQTEENSEKTLELSKKGREAMQSTAGTINGVAEVVTQSSNQILDLKQQSDEIGSSAKLIADIADQTNLLALNAAIEAARAGEYGRGFAVVADEVRKLAERTSGATTQISAMIKQIQEEIQHIVESMNEAVPKAQESMELASETLEILDEIENQAQDSLSKAKDVSISSTQQENNIKNVEQKMHEMVEISQNTMKIITEASSVSKALENISNELKDDVGFFKV